MRRERFFPGKFRQESVIDKNDLVFKTEMAEKFSGKFPPFRDL